MVVGVILGVLFGLLFIYLIYSGIKVVKEKEVMIIERLGKFHNILPPGIHFIIPVIDQPRLHRDRYSVASGNGSAKLVERKGVKTVSTQVVLFFFKKSKFI